MLNVLWVAFGALGGFALAWRIRASSAATPGVPAAPSPFSGHPPSVVDELAPLALDALPLGLVLFGAAGNELLRNQFARDVTAQRHIGPLVAASVHELVGPIGSDPASEKSLDLYGPPRRNIDLTAIRIATTDGIVGSMVIIADVTEQRRVDEVRRDFVANVSHELKTPVGAISLLADALSAEDDHAVAERLTDRLQVESIRLGITIDDLLALSEIESERLTFGEVAVAEIISGALARSSGGAMQREIDVRIAQEGEALVVHGDRRQLVSALGNLVDNAVKYSDPGSEVWIRSERDDVHVVIRVEDRGIGIPQADLGRIFERFYRVDPARSRNTGGTGLGLSIVRNVVRNHDGHVAVTSTEGAGTTFTLYLPAANPPAADSPAASRSIEKDASS